MKNIFKITLIILLSSAFMIVVKSCKKEEMNKGVVPSVTTAAITDLKGIKATSGGTITDEGTGSVFSRGVCWGTIQNPTLSDCKTVDGSGTGSFMSNLTNLEAGTPYYVRAYATNDAGTGYGNQISFTTRKVTCSAGCSEMSWGITGESFGSVEYSNWTCTFTYVSSSYIKSCEGTWTFLESGNSYYVQVTYDWPDCSIEVEVEDVGTCSDKVGKKDDSHKGCDCGGQQVTEKIQSF